MIIKAGIHQTSANKHQTGIMPPLDKQSISAPDRFRDESVLERFVAPCSVYRFPFVKNLTEAKA